MPKIMTIRPPEKMQDALKGEAKQKGITINALIITILYEHLSKEGNRENQPNIGQAAEAGKGAWVPD